MESTFENMSTKRRNNKIVDVLADDISEQTEILPNSVVNKDVQSLFLPFTLMQTILWSPKCRIKNNVITANDLFNKVLLLCGTVLCMSVYLYGTIQIEQLRDFIIVKMQLCLLYYNFFYYFCGLFINFIVNLIQTKSSVLFVLTIQDVHRFLNNEVDSKRFVENSWISFIMTISFYIIFGISNIVAYPYIPFFVIIQTFILIHFDANIVCAIRFVKLLEDKVVQWSHQVSHPFNDEESQTRGQGLLQTYIKILKSYQIYEKLHHKMVLFYTVQNVLHSLMLVETLIELYKTPNRPHENYIELLSSTFIYIWLFKNLLLQTILSLYCEAFYIAVEDSQDICAYILTSNCTEEEKKLCKNVRRVHRASFTKMRACRLFYVDVCLLLHLAALLANYTVVLLQFAFL